MINKELYKQEVKELTELLRTEWEDIQEIAKMKNSDINKTFLLGFIESENNVELGLFYTDSKELIRFEKSFENLNLVTKTIESVEKEFPQVIVLDEIDNFENWKFD